jgi:hypothetical protein
MTINVKITRIFVTSCEWLTGSAAGSTPGLHLFS